ncbi:FxSxx-COOH system tetratricopeptide repeat protein [Streptomyces sp. B1866]|uniref:FxSxx-COOH system tetratricopeptide repeat protein n=1 Tax=Streptomyces sp. B1866 TaxID=3075431 RepID=UPI002891C6F8|nr:FxSxx-COOH system tetratricopeptide repeat protein [Streptomyces sp. B1866]MDT3400417.1 FxSxx-COOH system tetratricopeptide repeat protein [Streptomyces sp. B1866]
MPTAPPAARARAAAALPTERALARALRPFKRTAPSPVRTRVDEEATAERAARHRLWLPVRTPVRERWMDAVLVVDAGASMRVWRPVAERFAAVLERTGAFRAVRVQRVDFDRGLTATARPAAGSAAPPSPVDGMGPRDRRAVLVLTDGVGAAWTGGDVRSALGRWGRSATVAVVHVLPLSHWHRTGAAPDRVRLRVPGPGVPNGAWRRADGTPWPCGEAPVPVLELDAGWLRRWVDLVARPAAGGHDTLALLPGVPAEPWEQEDEQDAWSRVFRFRASASPGAFRLASRLAAAPLNIPVMEFVQGLHTPESGPGELAEVLLGGLLRRVGTADPADETDIGYEFHDGVRELLLSAGMRDETLYVLRSVLDRLGHRWKPLHVLRDLLARPSAPLRDLPEEDPPGSGRLLPYLRVQERVYQALSGPYLEGARTFEAFVRAHGDRTHTGESGRSAVPEPPRRGSPNREGPRTGAPERVPSSEGAPPPERGVPGTEAEEPTKGRPVSGIDARPAPEAGDRRAGDPPPIWGNVPPRNNNFTGRQELLDALHQRLSAEGTAAVLPEALHGLGGVGKSQIALEYVHQHAADFDAVWWIAAERPEQIRQSLVHLAERFGLRTGEAANTAVPSVLDALRTGRPYRNWLLVFDNAEEVETVRAFFPASGPGRVLVTSRNGQWSRVARTVEVDVFDRGESIELLRRRGPELPPGQADRVAETLGDLPLAIEQAAAWLSETGMPVDEYLHVFEDERADFSTRRHELLAAGVPVDYPEPVAAAWNMSLRRLSERHPGALQLLRVCSFFAPEPISRRLLTGVRGVTLPPELTEVLQDPIKLGHAIREINRYALIKINHQSNTIELHRLVQAVLAGQLSPQQQAEMRHCAHVLLAHGDPNEVKPFNWGRYADLLSHVRASRAMDCEDKWVRHMVRNLVRFLFVWGDHEGALEFGTQVRENWLEKLGEDSEETLAVARTLGHVLTVLGRYQEARDLNNRTLELLRATVGDEHENTLVTIGMVAKDARYQGDYTRSLELEHVRWSAFRRLFGPDEPFTAAAANDYALTLRGLGEFTEARRISQSARDSAAVNLGENASITLVLEANLAADMRESGDYLAARALLEGTMARVRRTLPEHAPVAVAILRVLGVVRRKAGDYEGGMACTRDALERYRLRYREPDLLITLTELNLSMDLRCAADLDGARELGHKALTDLRAMLGPGHPAALTAATDLAVTLRLLGEAEEARALNRETLPVVTGTLGARHPATLATAINLAGDHYALAEYQEARRLDTETLESCRSKLGEDHPTTLSCALNLSADLRATGDGGAAEELFQDALARLRRALGPGHPAVVAAARGIRADCDMESLAL